jgi:hypothetical protein
MPKFTISPEERANVRTMVERLLLEALADQKLREKLRSDPDHVLEEFGIPRLAATDVKRQVMIDGQSLHESAGPASRCSFTCSDSCDWSCLFFTKPATQIQ